MTVYLWHAYDNPYPAARMVPDPDPDHVPDWLVEIVALDAILDATNLPTCRNSIFTRTAEPEDRT